MEKAYDPHNIESKWYQRWEQSEHFKPHGDTQKDPYCIMIPPPNVTGSLHMGHAFQHTIMDALTRLHRMQGDNTLWQPGTDHAGIATQMVVERLLNAEGSSRQELGRAAFEERVWQWKEESGGTIGQQMRRLGDSPDWSRERFTMDEDLSEAVSEVFEQLFDEGIIYRGKRLVNWDPKFHTAVSDLEVLSDLVSKMPKVGDLEPGVVTEITEQQATVALAREIIQLNLESLKWAKEHKTQNSMGPTPKVVSDVLKAGDIIRVLETGKGWQLRQIPKVSSALVSLRPEDGAVLALTGGFDFYASKFNRATQALRQPGSAFKPFVYSAAIEAGFTPASIINDAPVVFEDRTTEDSWRPQNYSGKFFGPTRLRLALTKSRNMVSIRLLRDIGRKYTREHAGKFGFDVDKLPKDLTLALGSGAITPLTLASAYTVFANGGYRVEPYFIDRIEGPDQETLYSANPARVCNEECSRLATEISLHAEELAELGLTDSIGNENLEINMAPRVVPESNVYQMNSMLNDVIQRGTGRRALVLNRKDIVGKTGTTNDQHDAWFAGYHPNVVTVVWVGFDEHKPLGRGEVGGVAALPIWIDYMRVALQGEPHIERPLPEGMVVVKVNPENGLLVDQDSEFGIEEAFLEDQLPGLDFNVPAPIGLNRQKAIALFGKTVTDGIEHHDRQEFTTPAAYSHILPLGF